MSARRNTGPIPSPSEHHQRWRKYRQLRILDGTWNPAVDPEPAQRHLRALLAGGYSLRTVSLLSGVSTQTLFRLNSTDPSYRQAWMRHDASAMILAVPLRPDLDLIPDAQEVPSLGTQRRLKALCVMGWSMTWIGAQLGTNKQLISQTCLHAERVTARRARAVRDLYDRYSDVRGPSASSASRARSRGWAPPAAWDDIDDPTETAKGLGGATAGLGAGGKVAELAAMGLDVQEIARRLHIKRESVERALERVASKGDAA